MNAPLSRYLTHFSSDVDESVTVNFAAAPPAVMIALAPQPAPEPVETETEIALRAAKQDADAQREREIANLAEAHAKSLETALETAVAAARSDWAIHEATKTAALIDTAFAHLHLDLSNRIAAALKPLLTDAVVARTLEVLRQTIDRILADPDHPALTVRGPFDLIEALRAQRPDFDGITFETGDGVEITVIADGMHIETRLGNALIAINGREP